MALTGELILARHGQAHCNLAGVAGGDRTCTGLTPAGRHQVTALSRRLRAEHESGRPIDVLYSSPRLRVRQTAEILAADLGLEPTEEPGLAGLLHGQADGKPWAELKAAFGGPPQARPDRAYAVGAETWNDYLARTCAALGGLLGRHSGQRILVAGHGETIESAFTLLLGLPPGTSTRVGFAPAHASLTRWARQRNRLGQQTWILTTFNDTCHLEGGA
ncbi:MAG TPA: histidine phosphatase family protein [Streptosporangiaceae bacterium]|nr:histidine phosphatase family protein [Streptosporangiaceae bacterium]